MKSREEHLTGERLLFQADSIDELIIEKDR
jgi:hypothetical protein